MAHKVRFAPIVIPFERRLQTFAVFLWGAQLLICILIIFLFVIQPWLWPFLIAYIIWMISDDAPTHGGRPYNWFRNSLFWRNFSNYFPISLKKDYALDPKKNYIFGYHPHGIIGVGALGNFAANNDKFSREFPGIDIRVCTLDSNFKVPIWRDFLMASGLISVSKTSVENFLNQGPGKSALIVIGGAAEALDARPGTNDLTLRDRKGFVKLAIRNGASLVPVFSFGENDVFEQLIENHEGSPVRAFQNKFKKLFGFSLPFFIGRGVFNYDFGFLPHRRAIVSIVGQPIDTVKIEEPTPEEVNKIHELYMKNLEELYNKYKDVHAPHRKREMQFVH